MDQFFINKEIIFIKNKKISKQWDSVGEVRQSLEKFWTQNFNANVVEMRDDFIKKHVGDYLKSDVVVLDYVNHFVAKNLTKIIKLTKWKPVFIIYLYGHASRYCWHYHLWGLDEIFTENDIFVASSKSDLECMRHCYENANVILQWFPLELSLKRMIEHHTGEKTKHYIYAGRIAEPKNIHLTIVALSILKSRGINFKFEIFGEEEHGGSPIMGLPQGSYKFFLEELVEELGLEKDVSFMGKFSKEELENYLQQTPHCFISLSTHADENFGVGPYTSLSFGQSAILTSWGGYREFKDIFDSKVDYVNVYESELGPVVSIDDVVAILLNRNEVQGEKNTFDEKIKCHHENFIASIKTRKSRANIPLVSTSIRKRVLEQAKSFSENEGYPLRLFTSYRDKLSWIFFRVYGMRSEKIRLQDSFDSLVPWVKCSPTQNVVVLDPVKGYLDFELDQQEVDEMSLANSNFLKRMASFGYVYSKGLSEK